MDLRITVNNTEVFNCTAHEFKFIPGENDAYQLIGLFGRGSSRLADFIDYLIDEVSEENIYELWLHKVYDREYNEFRDQCYGIVAQEATNRSIDVDKVDFSRIKRAGGDFVSAQIADESVIDYRIAHQRFAVQSDFVCVDVRSVAGQSDTWQYLRVFSYACR